MFQQVLRRGVRGRRGVERAGSARGRPLRLGGGLDLRAPPVVPRGRPARARSRRATSRARACSRCSATPSRPTTSRRPARSRRARRRRSTSTSTASRSADFNSYGARRGNHEVMMRGTFANIRLRNLLAGRDDLVGGLTLKLPEGEPMPIYDAAMRVRRGGHAAGRARRQGVRLGLVARLGGEGHQPARRARRDRAVVRAHPPLQPRRHGRAAAAVRRRRVGRVARPDGRGGVLDHGDRERRGASEVDRAAPATRSSPRGSASTPRRRSSTTSTAASCRSCCASCWSAAPEPRPAKLTRSHARPRGPAQAADGPGPVGL